MGNIQEDSDDWDHHIIIPRAIIMVDIIKNIKGLHIIFLLLILSFLYIEKYIIYNIVYANILIGGYRNIMNIKNIEFIII